MAFELRFQSHGSSKPPVRMGMGVFCPSLPVPARPCLFPSPPILCPSLPVPGVLCPALSSHLLYVPLISQAPTGETGVNISMQILAAWGIAWL